MEPTSEVAAAFENSVGHLIVVLRNGQIHGLNTESGYWYQETPVPGTEAAMIAERDRNA